MKNECITRGMTQGKFSYYLNGIPRWCELKNKEYKYIYNLKIHINCVNIIT